VNKKRYRSRPCHPQPRTPFAAQNALLNYSNRRRTKGRPLNLINPPKKNEKYSSLKHAPKSQKHPSFHLLPRRLCLEFTGMVGWCNQLDTTGDGGYCQWQKEYSRRFEWCRFRTGLSRSYHSPRQRLLSRVSDLLVEHNMNEELREHTFTTISAWWIRRMVAVDVQGVEICLLTDAYVCCSDVDSADAGGRIPAQKLATLCRPCSAGLVETDVK